MGWGVARGLCPPQRNFLEFSSKDAGFYTFYCKATICGQKPGPGE